MKTSTRLFLSVALLAGAFAFALPFATAGEDGATPAVPATSTPSPAVEPAPAATTPAPAADAPKTPSPIHTMMMWVGKQVMGSDECCCPSTEKGAAAWRKWFAGDANVPLAGLRDALVATGWTADKTITFFSEMAKNKGACCEGKGEGKGEAKGECKGTCQGECQKGCCGKCKGLDKNKPAETPAPAAPATPAPAEGATTAK